MDEVPTRPKSGWGHDWGLEVSLLQRFFPGIDPARMTGRAVERKLRDMKTIRMMEDGQTDHRRIAEDIAERRKRHGR